MNVVSNQNILRMNSLIKSLSVVLLLLLTNSVNAQNKYCTSLQDFKANNWITISDNISLKSINENRLAYQLKADNKELRKTLRKSSFVLFFSDSLYLNLNHLKYFGDCYVRTWRLGDNSLVFARPDIAPTNGVWIGVNGMAVPISANTFKSKSKMKNLVCYIYSESNTGDEPELTRVTEDIMRELLSNRDVLLSKYESYEQKRRDDADIVVATLLEAGLIQ